MLNGEIHQRRCMYIFAHKVRLYSSRKILRKFLKQVSMIWKELRIRNIGDPIGFIDKWKLVGPK